MKDDDFINKNSIDELIKYSEDSSNIPDDEPISDFDSPDGEEFEEPPREEYSEIPDEEFTEDEFPDEEFTDDELLDDDIFGDLNDEEKKSGIKPGVVIAIVAAVVVLGVFFTVNDEIIGSYKNNFSSNFSKIFGNFISSSNNIPEPTKKPEEYKTDIKNAEIISLTDATSTEFATYKDGFLIASANHLSYINKNGEIIWEIDTAIVSPILSAEGNYILLAERERNKLCLYDDKNLAYDTDDADAIMAAKVSANGDVVLVTDKSAYKGGISVYNKSGDQIYSWVSGGDAVISADISSSSRRIAVALLNTEISAKSMIQFFDINLENSYAQVNVDDTVIYNLHFTGNTLSAFGDNRLMTLSDSGKILSDVTFSDAALNHSAVDDDGNKLLSLDDGNSPLLKLFNKNGAEKDTMILRGMAGYIDLKGKNILYSIGRDIYYGKINTKKAVKYTASMDIKKLLLISDNAFVIVYSNSVEVVQI